MAKIQKKFCSQNSTANRTARIEHKWNGQAQRIIKRKIFILKLKLTKKRIARKLDKNGRENEVCELQPREDWPLAS
jgi:hypothetical protein